MNDNTFAQTHAPPGSTLYYSFLSAPKPTRQCCIALITYAKHIAQIAEQYRESTLAMTKLSWWQGEIERLYEGSPQHEITQQLGHYLGDFQINQTALLAIIEAAQLTIETGLFETRAQMNQHYSHTGGIVLTEVAHCLLGQRDQNGIAEYATTIGIALETIRHVILFPEHASREHLYLPTTELSARDIDPATAFHTNQPAALSHLFAEETTALTTIIQTLNEDCQKIAALRPLRIMLRIAQKRFDLIAKHGFDLFRKTVDLTPLHKLWVAWCTK